MEVEGEAHEHRQRQASPCQFAVAAAVVGLVITWVLAASKARRTEREVTAHGNSGKQSTDRHTDTQTDTHTDTQIHAHRHRDTETHRHTNRHTHRHTPTFFTPGFSRTEWDMSSLSHSCRSAGRRRGEGHGRGMRRSRKRKQGWGEGRVAATASIGECQVAYVWSFR